MNQLLDRMPTLRARSDGLWTVAEDWCIVTSLGIIRVKRGFVTDGASVPRMAWFLAGHPMESPRVLAALAHDWLYAAHVCTREEADAVYREILLRYRAAWRVAVEHAALRVFGEAAWVRTQDEIDFAREHGALVRTTASIG